jgi:glucose-6-phosphate isomerase
MSKLTRSPTWQALKDHQKSLSRQHLRDLFRDDDQRFARFSLMQGEILLDY